MMKILSGAAFLYLAAAAPAFAAAPAELRGAWYLSGNPYQPTSIGITDRGALGLVLTFTNAQGDTVLGQMFGGDGVVVGWPGPHGNLIGRIGGDPLRNAVITWDNGTYWTRVPERPLGWDDGRSEGRRDDWRYRDRRGHDWRDHDGRYRRP